LGDDNIQKQAKLNNELKQAMYSHDYAEARRLVDKGADPNTTNGWGSPFIHWCAEKGRIDLIDFALEKGADVNAVNKSGETALHKAAQLGIVNVINHLIDSGANINHKNIYDTTPLFVAARSDQPEAVKTLLARGADPSIRNYNGVSAAQKAKEKGHDAIVTLLAERRP
jgi:ankyrin repeat protein